jgi:hypothetical protein
LLTRSCDGQGRAPRPRRRGAPPIPPPWTHPQPLDPTMAVVVPGSTVKDTPFSTARSGLYPKRTSLNSMRPPDRANALASGASCVCHASTQQPRGFLESAHYNGPQRGGARPQSGTGTLSPHSPDSLPAAPCPRSPAHQNGGRLPSQHEHRLHVNQRLLNLSVHLKHHKQKASHRPIPKQTSCARRLVRTGAAHMCKGTEASEVCHKGHTPAPQRARMWKPRSAVTHRADEEKGD